MNFKLFFEHFEHLKILILNILKEKLFPTLWTLVCYLKIVETTVNFDLNFRFKSSYSFTGELNE